nr:putative periplasmic binding protein [Nostoc sp. PCC 7120 = FACHB-418]
MSRRINRRRFLIYGSATIGSSILLKACANSTPNATNSPATSGNASPVAASGGNTIKIGILHSLSGTMSSVKNRCMGQIKYPGINAACGVLGKQIEPIVEDGASNWDTFREKATKLIDQDKVAVVFGCWTSASRKNVKPVFESKDHMLWYPVQYEGQECSKNIFYTGAAPNQQIEPSVDWLLKNKGKEFFLVGSDYVFPRTANTIIKAQLEALGGKTVGEDYLPLGNTEVTPIISKIKQALPNGGVIYNTLNGDSNVAFFKQLKGAGLTPDKHPSMSVSIAEEEVKAIGVEYLKGHYAAWNYFQTVDTPVIRNLSKLAKDMVQTRDKCPDEAAYIAVYLWKQSVEKAGSPDLAKVRAAAYGQTIDAPEGKVTVNTNHHISKIVRIGEVRDDGLFDIIYATPAPVEPVPWNQFVKETKGFACDWSDPGKGEKYKKA